MLNLSGSLPSLNKVESTSPRSASSSSEKSFRIFSFSPALLLRLVCTAIFPLRNWTPISTRWNLLDSLHHLLNPALVGLGFFVIVHADKKEVSRVMLQGCKIFFLADLVYCAFGGVVAF